MFNFLNHWLIVFYLLNVVSFRIMQAGYVGDDVESILHKLLTVKHIY